MVVRILQAAANMEDFPRRFRRYGIAVDNPNKPSQLKIAAGIVEEFLAEANTTVKVEAFDVMTSMASSRNLKKDLLRR